jgi:hypothetical protein
MNNGTFGSTSTAIMKSDPFNKLKGNVQSLNDLKRIGVFNKSKKFDTIHPSKNVNGSFNNLNNINKVNVINKC